MKKDKKDKMDFKKKKDKTFRSLLEVESFLNRTCQIKKYNAIGKLFKK